MGVARWRRRLRKLASVRSRDDLRDVSDRALALGHKRLHPDFPVTIHLNYPPSAEIWPRYGYGRPRHEVLAGILARSADTYRAELESFRPYVADLREIPLRESGRGQPFWLNRYLPGLDIVSLYGYIRKLAPRCYVEVGSGVSTAVAGRARQDGGLDTRITSIDPAPRSDIDGLCDDVIREPLETLGGAPFAELEGGDVLFFDGSHRVYTNSDVTAFYLDILPSLPGGVVVGIHDILWPDDYLPELTGYWWSEQYLLGALLLGGAAWLRPMLASAYAAADPDLGSVLDELWRELPSVDRRGFTLWAQIDDERRPF